MIGIEEENEHSALGLLARCPKRSWKRKLRLAQTGTKVSLLPSSTCPARTVLMSSLHGERLDGKSATKEFQPSAAAEGFDDKKNFDSIDGRRVNRGSADI